MRIVRNVLAILLVTSGGAALCTACSGSDLTDLFAPADAAGGSTRDGSGGDGATSLDGSTGNDSGEEKDTGGPDSEDAGLVVHESPSPTCHDLAQRAALVTPTASPGDVPAPNPLQVLKPGLYVAVAITEYQTNATFEQAQRLTVDVTPSRYYYLFENMSPGQRLVYTLDWTLAEGQLTRTIVCTSSPGGGTAPVKNRVDVAPNGYTLYSTSTQGRPLAIRYQRMN